ncbi:serine/threonine-protein kinase [Luteolibacter sp. GHJ8]|uniref:Serine/threonine-protein kinase n=1 Tax=Luteolibacter rhizosphaerae TaxID=2989719 RepID=A0ABT3G0M2_9BACT|nr:serine/threonine-protein kinase [Luteolibacter rhizosphaerae]MCW1913390.1 serine/threonine-protein kinase [Luteolibacter rhizosphaerae]
MATSSPALCETCGDPLPVSREDGGHCSRCLFKTSFGNLEEELPSEEDGAQPWTRIANYELYEEIGRGGMGVVYRARQTGLDRIIAVKVLLQAKFAGEEQRERFLREAQTAARLRHPGITRIHDIGEDEGTPWFSMEYVEGKSLEQLVREHPMDSRDAASCVKQVAEAVQHAHEHGVLHRDLKPSNILLDEEGVPRVTDFGIARILGSSGDNATLTRTGQILGSPGYAAPEQALGGETGVQTDVYGLGALLYHLLTGRPPFQGPTIDAILMQLREDDPLSPRRLNPAVPQDLETICLHCLWKDVRKRYASAAELAADLERFLKREPIRARPISPAGIAWRWCRRKPWVAALLGVSILLGATLVAGSLMVARREHREQQRTALLAEARELRLEATGNSRGAALQALASAWKIGNLPEIRNEAIACLALPGLRLETTTMDAVVPDRRSADGSREVRHEKGEVIVTESGREITRFGGYDKPPLLKLDHRGKRVAIVRPVGPKSANAIEIHELPSGKLLGRLDHDNPVTCLDWADELLVAGGSSNRLIHLWDTQRFRLLHRFSGHQADLETVMFRKGGQEFISMARDGMLRVWHAGCAAEVMALSGLPEHAGQGEWSADGTRLKLRRFDGSATSVFRFDWPRNVRVLGPGIAEPRSENIPSLDLDHEGKFAATTDESGCRLWATDTGSMAGLFPKLDREWLSCALAPDASALWLVGWNSPMRKIPVKTGAWPEIGQPEKIGPGPGPLLVAMNADGSAVAMTQNLPETKDDFVGVLSTKDGKFTRLAQVDPFSAAFSPDGKRVVTGSFRSKGAQVWSLPDGRLEKRLEHPELVTNAAFTAGGRELWLWSGKALSRWRSEDWSQAGELVRSVPPGLTVDREGGLAASVTRQAVVIHRAADLQELARLAVPEQAGEVGMATLQFSRDGRRLGLHTADGNLVLWDLPGLRAELARMGMDWVD